MEYNYYIYMYTFSNLSHIYTECCMKGSVNSV